MAYDPSVILNLSAAARDGDLVVRWISSAPAGTRYQLYLDRALAWSGTTLFAVVPHPAATVRIDVGAVLAAEAYADLAASLPTVAGGGSRIALQWLGGTFLGASIAGFNVYVAPAPGASISYATATATVAAYPGGILASGFGQGPYGCGAVGLSASQYSWTSGPVSAGTWNVAVAPVDSAGNVGTPYAWSVTVSGPPAPVARNASGQRLTYTAARQAPGGLGSGGYGAGAYGTGETLGMGAGGYGAGAYGIGEGENGLVVTLNWLASPGA